MTTKRIIRILDHSGIPIHIYDITDVDNADTSALMSVDIGLICNLGHFHQEQKHKLGVWTPIEILEEQ